MVCTNSSAASGKGPCPTCVACLILSDDDGKSWTLGGLGPLGTRESEVVQVPSTSGKAAFYMNARNMGATPGHRISASCTAGGATCGDYRIDASLTSPITPHWTGVVAAVVGVPDVGGVMLVYTGPGSTTARANMTARTSTDGGSTWSAATTVWPGPAAYSDLAVMAPTRGARGVVTQTNIALIFENGDSTFADRVSVQLLSVSATRQATF